MRFDEAQGTVTQKPVSPGRARYRPLTPSRRECRCFGFICGDYTRVLSTTAHEAAGAAKHPAFPAPSHLLRAVGPITRAQRCAAGRRRRALFGRSTVGIRNRHVRCTRARFVRTNICPLLNRTSRNIKQARPLIKSSGQLILSRESRGCSDADHQETKTKNKQGWRNGSPECCRGYCAGLQAAWCEARVWRSRRRQQSRPDPGV